MCGHFVLGFGPWLCDRQRSRHNSRHIRSSTPICRRRTNESNRGQGRHAASRCSAARVRLMYSTRPSSSATATPFFSNDNRNARNHHYLCGFQSTRCIHNGECIDFRYRPKDQQTPYSDMFHDPCVDSDVAALDLVTGTVYVQRAFVWASASGVHQVIFSG